MTEEQKKALDQVAKELAALSPEEFQAELEKHKEGEWSQLIMRAMRVYGDKENG